MNATTVPPPGWNPIGASEIRQHARRFFSRALAISAAVHLAVPAGFLVLRAREPASEPKWLLSPIHLVSTPPIPRLVPPAPRDPGRAAPPHEGTPIPKSEVRVEMPSIPGPVSLEDQTKNAPPNDAPSQSPPSDGTEIDRVPAEDAFVVYDRPPLPYYRPAPEYPQWARDAGIEGRVVLHVLVGRDGRVMRIKVLHDVEGLTGAAREAITRWLFHPALSGKNAVAVWVEIPIEFRL